jgi:hypothetical protein
LLVSSMAFMVSCLDWKRAFAVRDVSASAFSARVFIVASSLFRSAKSFSRLFTNSPLSPDKCPRVDWPAAAWPVGLGLAVLAARGVMVVVW